MTRVIDASVAVPWLFELENSKRSEKLLGAGERLIAPDLVIAEVTNAAWKLVAFEGASADAIDAILPTCARLFDELVPLAGLEEAAFKIAVELRHAAYDCFYLALAEARGVRLVTADDKLVRRCARTRYAKLIERM